jgi:hypothetical protein
MLHRINNLLALSVGDDQLTVWARAKGADSTCEPAIGVALDEQDVTTLVSYLCRLARQAWGSERAHTIEIAARAALHERRDNPRPFPSGVPDLTDLPPSETKPGGL